MEFFSSEQPALVQELIGFLISARRGQTVTQSLLEVEVFEKILGITEHQDCPRVFERVCEFFSVWFTLKPSKEY